MLNDQLLDFESRHFKNRYFCLNSFVSCIFSFGSISFLGSGPKGANLVVVRMPNRMKSSLMLLSMRVFCSQEAGLTASVVTTNQHRLDWCCGGVDAV